MSAVNQSRDRIVEYLLEHHVCVVTTSGTAGAWAMPARYRSLARPSARCDLAVECVLPRWADVVYHLEQNPQALLTILDFRLDGLRWLQYQGRAEPISLPVWSDLLPDNMATARPEQRYVALRITPTRIDLIDETQGWGARETLDF